MSSVKTLLKSVALAALVLCAGGAQAQALSGAALLKSLQKGGNVILMRHASSPRTTPDRATAARGNVSQERQLDAAGISAATAMGKALRDLKIPVSMLLSSTTFRALETARYIGVAEPKAYSDLSDGGASMQRVNPELGIWIRELAQQPLVGGNMLIITHVPNITAAYPQYAADLADGEALVLGKDGKGAVILLARVKIEDWPKLGQ